jgi:hypothetical protein
MTNSWRSLVFVVYFLVFSSLYLGLYQFSYLKYKEDYISNVEQKTELYSYIDNKEGFKLNYTDYWYQDSIQRPNVLLDLKFLDRSATITVKKYDNVNHLTQKELNEYELSEDYKKQIESTGEITSLELETDTIRGIPIVKLTYVETNTIEGINRQFKTSTIYIIKDENLFFGINYISSPENFNKNLADAEKIIHSFEIINK